MEYLFRIVFHYQLNLLKNKLKTNIDVHNNKVMYFKTCLSC